MNIKTDWRDAVAVVAPVLGSALLGPWAGLAAKEVLGIFGIAPDAPDAEASMVRAIDAATPEQLRQLRDADGDFRIRLRELGVDETAIHSGDRTSAREREVALGGWANPALAGVVVLGFLGLAGWAVSGRLEGLTDVEIALVGTVFGAVSAKVDQIMSYYFGSSKGSALKTEILGRGFK